MKLYKKRKLNSHNHMNLAYCRLPLFSSKWWKPNCPGAEWRRLPALPIVNLGAEFLAWEAANASLQNKRHYRVLDDVCILKVTCFCYTACYLQLMLCSLFWVLRIPYTSCYLQSLLLLIILCRIWSSTPLICHRLLEEEDLDRSLQDFRCECNKKKASGICS